MLRNSTNIIVCIETYHYLINSINLKQCTHKVSSQFHRLQNKAQASSCCTLAGGGARPGPGGEQLVGACAEASQAWAWEDMAVVK